MTLKLGVRRNDGETWRECAARHAEHLSEEVLEEFDRQVANGTPEGEACWGALWDWDCLTIIDVPDDADLPVRP